jgi:hypothetical protein
VLHIFGETHYSIAKAYLTECGREVIEALFNDMEFQSQLAQYYFEKYVLEVAIATLEQGVAASKLDTYQFLPPVDAWGFPKYPSKTAILSPAVDLVGELKNFIAANETFLREVDSWLGTWINPRTQHFYLDITTSHHDLNEAKKMALEIGNREGRSIVALYNSKRNETIYL